MSRQPPYIAGPVSIGSIARGRADVVTIKLRSSHATRCPPMDLEVDGARKSRPVAPPLQVAVYNDPADTRRPRPADEVCRGLLTSEAWTRHRGGGPAFTYEATIIVSADALLSDDGADLELLTRWWIGRESPDLVVRFPGEDEADDHCDEDESHEDDDTGLLWLRPEARNYVVQCHLEAAAAEPPD